MRHVAPRADGTRVLGTRLVAALALATGLVAAPATPLAAQAAASASPPATRIDTRGLDTLTSVFDVNGLRVILRRNTANEVVAANLYLLGGPRVVPEGKEGMELLLLEASERGTRKYSRDALRRTMARLGTGIITDPDRDWTVFGLRATRAGLDSTWSVFADRLMAPSLDSTEVERVRERFLSAVRQRGDDAESLLEELADSVAFDGHPYGRTAVGTVQSLSSITRDDLRRFHRERMVTSRMLLVVVGNVTREKIERLVRTTIGTLPKGSYAWTLPDTLPTRAAAVSVVPRQLPTNYLLGYYSGPAADSRDAAALRVASAILSGRLFNEIRARRNLTYAVNAPFLDRAITAGGLYVSTVAPDTTLALMQREIVTLQRELVDPAGLEQLVQQFLTNYYLDNETNADQADALARAVLFRGDHRHADRFIEEVQAVTPQDVQRVARRYMRGIRFAYVGDPRRISRAYVARF